MMSQNRSYWENRYREDRLGWDIGTVSTPLKHYIDQLTDKDLNILIPGAGNGYEAVYLLEQGFTNVHVLDIAQQPLLNITTRKADFPRDRLINKDFFEYSGSGFDLILEQTFFCSLPPVLRTSYVHKMFDLLADSGKLVGLLFDFELNDHGPPFGGSLEEYSTLFDMYFKIKTLERAYNSIEPRKDNELFFIFEKQK